LDDIAVSPIDPTRSSLIRPAQSAMALGLLRIGKAGVSFSR